MLLMKELQDKRFVIVRPTFVGQPNEHVEGTAGLFNLQTVDLGDSLEAVIPPPQDALRVGFHPSSVLLQASEITHLSGCGGAQTRAKESFKPVANQAHAVCGIVQRHVSDAPSRGVVDF